jgi:iron complex outermembrane recepter protein
MIYKSILSYLIIIILLHSTTGIDAQNATAKTSIEIQGRIVNVNLAPVAFATVALVTLDSIPIDGEISDDLGNFTIASQIAGTYRLMVQHLEYESYYSEPLELTSDKKIVQVEIVLKPSSVSLDEVVVIARKAIIEIQTDKIVFNVSASPSASGTNGLDLLRKSAGVTVDMDNNISLLCKGGVQIYINGVQSRLAGTDLATMLESLSSDNIESIEIISNPSARNLSMTEMWC